MAAKATTVAKATTTAKAPQVLSPRSVIFTEWRGEQICLVPAHRLRADHPLVKQVGADAFGPERPLDFED